jgi:hypothetical protein
MCGSCAEGRFVRLNGDRKARKSAQQPEIRLAGLPQFLEIAAAPGRKK